LKKRSLEQKKQKSVQFRAYPRSIDLTSESPIVKFSHHHMTSNFLRPLGLLACLSTLFCTACADAPKPPPAPAPPEISTFRCPAEYEPQQAVWLLWPQVEHRRNTYNANVTTALVRALLPFTTVKLVAPNDSVLAHIQKTFPDSVLKNSRLQLLKFPFQEFWARDMGPVFLKNENGQRAIADFAFNDWGYGKATDPDVAMDEKLDETIAAANGWPLLSTEMVSEGGDREINAKGTLLVVRAVETQRNPSLSLPQMEVELRRTLGAKKIIWLNEGLYEDEHTFDGPLKGPRGRPVYTVFTTNGHVDEFARFANDSTILLASVDSADLNDPIARENARRLAENYEILRAATDQNGRPFRIVRLPLPKAIIAPMQPGDPIYDYISELDFADGSKFPKGRPVLTIAAASYLNFLITNGVVIAPRYARADADPDHARRDDRARQILQSVFPDRKIILLDALSVNWGGGGIHCITMHEPE
jgi:agmatine deiminase